mmetsp:Transcript_112361/g.194883  ORF Transcript_112361/g.194883 Transcript_112361/m.194883 type:complete len:656 (-) Transcript_112361:14-1981(-)
MGFVLLCHAFLFCATQAAAQDGSPACNSLLPPDETNCGSLSLMQRNAREKISKSVTLMGKSSGQDAMTHALADVLAQGYTRRSRTSAATLSNTTVDAAAADVLSRLITVHKSLNNLAAPPSAINATTRWLVSTVIFMILAFIGMLVGLVLHGSTTKSCKEAVQAQPCEARASELEHATPRDVVEALGFGLAQLQVTLLADGVWFMYGCLLALVNMVATSTSRDLGLGNYETAMLSSVAMLGLVPGCFFGGFLGDRFGRKLPILVSYIAMAAGSLGTSLAPNYATLVSFRALLGMACGFGLSPSYVIGCETSPVRWHGAMVGIRGVLYCTGTLLASLLCYSSDPALTHLSWRHCFVMTVPAALLLLISSCLFLHESPVFLACKGQHAKAERVFTHMRSWNSRPAVSIQYAGCGVTEELAKPTSTGSLQGHLQIIFSFGMLGCTATLLGSNIAGQMFHQGHNYGLPRVLIASRLLLSPGAQLVIDASWGYVGAFLVFALDWFLTRKNMLLVIYGSFTVVFVTFACASGSAANSRTTAAILQGSMALLRVLIKLNTSTVQLASAESYPTALLSTGTAICVGGGRIGAGLGPMLFEWLYVSTHMVSAFYWACCGIAFLNGLAIWRLLPADLETARSSSSDQLAALMAAAAARRANFKLK